ncbi:MAG: SagB/ThcOx family dehydrogenase, partial [Nitrospinota bacterium]
GVYHYHSKDHSLMKRMDATGPFLEGIGNDCYIALTSLFWREKWKYGERAFRYCHIDLGHALAALRYSLALFGWSAIALTELADDTVAKITGINRIEDFPIDDEREFPGLIIKLNLDRMTNDKNQLDASLKKIENLASRALGSVWQGKADSISKHQHKIWNRVEEVAEDAKIIDTKSRYWIAPKRPFDISPALDLNGAKLIKQRRSATSFDAQFTLPFKSFARILEATMVAYERVPFDIYQVKPTISLLLLVHSVSNLDNGLYLLPRISSSINKLQSLIRSEFDWENKKVEDIELLSLRKTNSREFAQIAACHQSIAAHSSFSLFMLADFKEQITNEPSRYKDIYIEAGVIGHALYLEAEAAGVRGVGIGCFFDDFIHEMLGIKDNSYQVVYGFTIGKPIHDSRFKTFEPYKTKSKKVL